MLQLNVTIFCSIIINGKRTFYVIILMVQTKLFSDLYLAKLLDTSAKPSCSICNEFKFPIKKQLRCFSYSKKFFIPCEKYDLFITIIYYY